MITNEAAETLQTDAEARAVEALKNRIARSEQLLALLTRPDRDNLAHRARAELLNQQLIVIENDANPLFHLADFLESRVEAQGGVALRSESIAN